MLLSDFYEIQDLAKLFWQEVPSKVLILQMETVSLVTPIGLHLEI
jgi:hypothetical protein